MPGTAQAGDEVRALILLYYEELVRVAFLILPHSQSALVPFHTAGYSTKPTLRPIPAAFGSGLQFAAGGGFTVVFRTASQPKQM